LASHGFTNLPYFPPKRLLSSEEILNERQRSLEQYLKTLVERKDTRNSPAVRLFLQLEEFCPEVLLFTPKLLGVMR
jgi:hypothetical protein